MSVADLVPGFAPARTSQLLPSGNWRVTVTPPAFMKLPGCSVVLNPDQYARYLKWRETGMYIQNALPELTNAQREVLMSGIGADDFARIWPEEEDQ